MIILSWMILCVTAAWPDSHTRLLTGACHNALPLRNDCWVGNCFALLVHIEELLARHTRQHCNIGT